MKDWKSQFKEWLKEICPWDQLEKYVQFKGNIPKSWNLVQQELRTDDRIVEGSVPDDKNIIRVKVFSTDYSYAIVAKENYLGCVKGCRKSRAGEWWCRGSDLPDGGFSRETWDSIKNAITRSELVKVVPNHKSVADIPK